MRCSNCGIELEEGSAFCPQCGARQNQNQSTGGGAWFSQAGSLDLSAPQIPDSSSKEKQPPAIHTESAVERKRQGTNLTQNSGQATPKATSTVSSGSWQKYAAVAGILLAFLLCIRLCTLPGDDNKNHGWSTGGSHLSSTFASRPTVQTSKPQTSAPSRPSQTTPTTKPTQTDPTTKPPQTATPTAPTQTQPPTTTPPTTAAPLDPSAFLGSWKVISDGVAWTIRFRENGSMDAGLGFAYSEFLDWYDGSWALIAVSENQYTVQLDLVGGSVESGAPNEKNSYTLIILITANGNRIFLQRLSGSDMVYLSYDLWYDRDTD